MQVENFGDMPHSQPPQTESFGKQKFYNYEREEHCPGTAACSNIVVVEPGEKENTHDEN